MGPAENILKYFPLPLAEETGLPDEIEGSPGGFFIRATLTGLFVLINAVGNNEAVTDSFVGEFLEDGAPNSIIHADDGSPRDNEQDSQNVKHVAELKGVIDEKMSPSIRPFRLFLHDCIIINELKKMSAITLLLYVLGLPHGMPPSLLVPEAHHCGSLYLNCVLSRWG
jgi:hypothetical protein